MNKKDIILKMIEQKQQEIIICELTEKHLQRQSIQIGGNKYNMALANIQGQLKEAKSFLLFLEEELKEIDKN